MFFLAVPNPPSAQQAVSRNCGLGSSKILFNFAAAALVLVALETRNCKRSRCLVVRERGTPRSIIKVLF